MFRMKRINLIDDEEQDKVSKKIMLTHEPRVHLRDIGPYADFIMSLRKNGWAVIKNVVDIETVDKWKNQFYDYFSKEKNFENYHKWHNAHNIEKKLANCLRTPWEIRLDERVQEPFKQFWSCDKLSVSLDSFIYQKGGKKFKTPNFWVHCDQPLEWQGLRCIQGQLNLTDNDEAAFVCFEGSVQLHEELKNKTDDHKSRFLRIPTEYFLECLSEGRVKTVKVPMKKGDMLFWDSRLWHCSDYGKEQITEERLVQCVCMLPAKFESDLNKTKKWEYVLDRRTTSHWPYPTVVNPMQGRTYGDDGKIIDYDNLYTEPIDDLLSKIKSTFF